MSVRRSHPVAVRIVGSPKPGSGAALRKRRQPLKYLGFIGAASAVLGSTYLGGSIGLALNWGERVEIATLPPAEPPPEMTMYLAPQQKPSARQIPTPPVPEIPPAAAPEPAVAAPELSPTVSAPSLSAQLPPLTEPDAPTKPKAAPVITAKKSAVAYKPQRKPARVAHENGTGVDHEQMPEKKSAASLPAMSTGPVAASLLDAVPRLLSSASVVFPASIKRSGISSGRAVLEVEIDTRGRVTIRRIIELSHPALASVARSFAATARFSTPRRGGQPVRATFRWPVTLRP